MKKRKKIMTQNEFIKIAKQNQIKSQLSEAIYRTFTRSDGEIEADIQMQEYFVNLDDEINLPEVDTGKINLHNYLVKPILRQHLENYTKDD